MLDLSPLAVPSTLRRLSPLLPPAPASVLEVGCGRGALAAELGRRGYRVLGVDPSPDAAQMAKERGVEVITAPVEELPEADFDVVLFTRSLHHVEDLDRSFGAAVRQLRPGGLIVLEEFATDGITAAAAAFLYDTVEVLAAAGLAEAHHRDQPDPLAQWRQDRAGLKSRPDMLAALDRHAAPGPVEDTETLWRIAASRLTGPDQAAATAIAQALAAIEQRRIDSGELPALGFVVAAEVAA